MIYEILPGIYEDMRPVPFECADVIVHEALDQERGAPGDLLVARDLPATTIMYGAHF